MTSTLATSSLPTLHSSDKGIFTPLAPPQLIYLNDVVCSFRNEPYKQFSIIIPKETPLFDNIKKYEGKTKDVITVKKVSATRLFTLDNKLHRKYNEDFEIKGNFVIQHTGSYFINDTSYPCFSLLEGKGEILTYVPQLL